MTAQQRKDTARAIVSTAAAMAAVATNEGKPEEAARNREADGGCAMSGSCDGCGGVCGECYCDEIAAQDAMQETPEAVRRRKAVERFRFLWREYVESDPATLTADAKALRERLIDLVEP